MEKRYWKIFFAVLGLVLAVSVYGVYLGRGFSIVLPPLLLASLFCFCVYFWQPLLLRSVRIGKLDMLALVVLLLCMIPLYSFKLYTIPWQINTDEVTIMVVAKQLVSLPGTDLFGLSYYFGFPSLIFVLFGWLAGLLGGIDLYHFRLVHSLFGVGSVLVCFLLFRQFMKPVPAFLGAFLLGTNHALFAISRMAMRDNTGLFLELLALLFLTLGFLRKSNFATFIGGVVTGLGFYTYFPGRITWVIWLLVLSSIAILYPARKSFKKLAHIGAIFLLGWILVALPVLFATVCQTSQAFEYQKQQFLLYPEGRALEQQWTGAENGIEAWKINIRNGLLMFNTAHHDEGYIYPNYGHGFVDTVTGVLLWLGVIAAVVRVVRRKETLGDIVALVGFFVLYVSFAFFITKAPNYTRLLVVLPFVAYFVSSFIWQVITLCTDFCKSYFRQGRLIFIGIAFAVVIFIGYSNIKIFKEFTALGAVAGNDVGSTARFVVAQKNNPAQAWVLAANKSYMYYSWGEPYQWQSWLGFFASESQPVVIIDPGELGATQFKAPTTMFISDEAWNTYEVVFRRRHPLLRITNITPDGRLKAIEVLGIR